MGVWIDEGAELSCMFACVCVFFHSIQAFPHSLINGTDHPQTSDKRVYACVCVCMYVYVKIDEEANCTQQPRRQRRLFKSCQKLSQALTSVRACVCVCVWCMQLVGGVGQALCQAPSYPGSSPQAESTNMGQKSCSG